MSCLFLGLCGLIGQGHFQFNPTYLQFIPLFLSAQQAAKIQSFFASTMTIGKIFACFLALKVNPRNILIVACILAIFGHIILLLPNQSINTLIIANIIIGFGYAPMWSSFLAFVDQNLPLTDRTNSIIMFPSGIMQV